MNEWMLYNTDQKERHKRKKAKIASKVLIITLTNHYIPLIVTLHTCITKSAKVDTCK